MKVRVRGIDRDIRLRIIRLLRDGCGFNRLDGMLDIARASIFR
jgi:hypothetical protein